MNIATIHKNNVLNTFRVSQETREEINFSEYLSDALSNLNNSQNAVSIDQEKFINGEIEAHELMSTVAESELALKLATSVASKFVTGIQELTNMQI